MERGGGALGRRVGHEDVAGQAALHTVDELAAAPRLFEQRRCTKPGCTPSWVLQSSRSPR